MFKFFRKFSSLSNLRDSEHLDIFTRLKQLQNPMNHKFSKPICLDHTYEARCTLGLWDVKRNFDNESFEIKTIPSTEVLEKGI
jgi:hypothetical protein